MRILKDERGLLFRNGEFIKVLLPGKHFIMPNANVEKYSVDKQFVPTKSLELLLENEGLRNELEVVEAKDGEILLRFDSNNFKGIIREGKSAFWKSYNKYKFVKINLNNPEMDGTVEKSVLRRVELREFVVDLEIENGKNGLLYIDNKFERIIDAGKYYFWKGAKAISFQKVDLRQQQMEIGGQDIMTKDKVGIRVNYFCQYKIVDIQKAMIEINNFENQFYVLQQLILREYIGTLTLDEILSKKEEIGSFILNKIKETAANLGVEVIYTGIKDIILPGDIKDIMNQVLIAEKKSQANLIMRREETASTRSLLNTAKLMEENETLFRLKELEYVERISEKINQISLSGGGQMIEQLKQMFLPEKKGA